MILQHIPGERDANGCPTGVAIYSGNDNFICHGLRIILYWCRGGSADYRFSVKLSEWMYVHVPSLVGVAAARIRGPHVSCLCVTMLADKPGSPLSFPLVSRQFGSTSSRSDKATDKSQLPIMSQDVSVMDFKSRLPVPVLARFWAVFLGDVNTVTSPSCATRGCFKHVFMAIYRPKGRERWWGL